MAVRSDGLRQGPSPSGNLLLIVGQDLTQQQSECLGQCRIWDVPHLHIELAGRHQGVFRRQTRLKLRDKR